MYTEQSAGLRWYEPSLQGTFTSSWLLPGGAAGRTADTSISAVRYLSTVKIIQILLPYNYLKADFNISKSEVNIYDYFNYLCLASI